MELVTPILIAVLIAGSYLFLTYLYIYCRYPRRKCAQQQTGRQPPVGTGQNAANLVYVVTATANHSSVTFMGPYTSTSFTQQSYVINASNQQHILAYPSPNYHVSSDLPPTYDTQNQNGASVPSEPCDDLPPPPYHTIVGQTRLQ